MAWAPTDPPSQPVSTPQAGVLGEPLPFPRAASSLPCLAGRWTVWEQRRSGCEDPGPVLAPSGVRALSAVGPEPQASPQEQRPAKASIDSGYPRLRVTGGWRGGGVLPHLSPPAGQALVVRPQAAHQASKGLLGAHGHLASLLQAPSALDYALWTFQKPQLKLGTGGQGDDPLWAQSPSAPMSPSGWRVVLLQPGAHTPYSPCGFRHAGSPAVERDPQRSQMTDANPLGHQ